MSIQEKGPGEIAELCRGIKVGDQIGLFEMYLRAPVLFPDLEGKHWQAHRNAYRDEIRECIPSGCKQKPYDFVNSNDHWPLMPKHVWSVCYLQQPILEFLYNALIYLSKALGNVPHVHQDFYVDFLNALLEVFYEEVRDRNGKILEEEKIVCGGGESSFTVRVKVLLNCFFRRRSSPSTSKKRKAIEPLPINIVLDGLHSIGVITVNDALSLASRIPLQYKSPTFAEVWSKFVSLKLTIRSLFQLFCVGLRIKKESVAVSENAGSADSEKKISFQSVLDFYSSTNPGDAEAVLKSLSRDEDLLSLSSLESASVDLLSQIAGSSSNASKMFIVNWFEPHANPSDDYLLDDLHVNPADVVEDEIDAFAKIQAMDLPVVLLGWIIHVNAGYSLASGSYKVTNIRTKYSVRKCTYEYQLSRRGQIDVWVPLKLKNSEGGISFRCLKTPDIKIKPAFWYRFKNTDIEKIVMDLKDLKV